MEADQLPRNWALATIEDVAEYVQRGKSPRYADLSDLPVINQKCVRWSGLEKEFVKYVHEDQISKWDEVRYLKKGDLLWNSTGTGTIGRACLYKGEFPRAVVDSHVTIVRSNSKIADPGYVHFFVMSPLVQKSFEAMQSGSTNQVELSRAAVLEKQIPVPPLTEQRRIVDKIESLFAQLDHGEASLRDVQKLLARYRQSVLKAAVTGQLTADWRAENADRLESGSDLLERILQTRRENWQGRGKYQEPSLETQRLMTLPKSWTWISVDTAGDVLLGRQRAPQYHAGETMHPYLRVANVYEDRLDLSDVKEMNFDETHFQKYKLEPGDILLAEGQTPDLVGRPAMFRGEIENCCFQKTLHRFRAAEWVNPDFSLAVFRFYLHSKRFKKSASITTNIGHLTLARFKEIEFPVPSLEEQVEIVSRLHAELSRIAAVELVCSAEFTRSTALRQSILKDAFAGKLVPQDPDDEPASELLARIRAERDTAAPKKRTRKKATA